MTISSSSFLFVLERVRQVDYVCPGPGPVYRYFPSRANTRRLEPALIEWYNTDDQLQKAGLCRNGLHTELRAGIPNQHTNPTHLKFIHAESNLFKSAFMLASKIIFDDIYSNKSLCIVGQGMFALREINQMEREMCFYSTSSGSSSAQCRFLDITGLSSLGSA